MAIRRIFSCVCSDISNLAHKNSPKLAQIIRFKKIVLYELKKIEYNFKLFSKILSFDPAIWYSFAKSPSELSTLCVRAYDSALSVGKL